jgi:class 3 adenylate cyclase/mannose-6-phosphate isomerase-like protein (cupin superfamily)
MSGEIVLNANEGKKIPWLGGEITLKITGADSAGLFSICEALMPAGGHGPQLHIHYAHDETYYVIEGELLVSLDGREVVASAGSLVVVPRGIAHTVSNPGDKPMRGLLLFTPAGYERSYEEIAQTFPSAVPPDLAELMPIMKKYDTEPAGTAIIFFADIADSVTLTERLGDAAFRERARELDGSLRTIIRDNTGTPIEGRLLGDGVLSTFTSASQAIAAALACGKAGDEAGLPLHLGLHAGDVIREEGNVYGGAVNIASRVAGEAAAGETLVSATVRDLARTSAGVTFEDRGERELKGIGEPVRVWAVRWREDSR